VRKRYTSRILRQSVEILDNPTGQQQQEAAAQRRATHQDWTNAKWTKRNDGKRAGQTYSVDQGPERIAAKTVQKQNAHGARHENEISNSIFLQAAENSKRHQGSRIHNGGARVDPKDLIKNQHPCQRSKQNNDRLRGYNAWEHRHVKAA